MNYTKSIRVTADAHKILQDMATDEQRDICIVTGRIIDLGLKRDEIEPTDQEKIGTVTDSTGASGS